MSPFSRSTTRTEQRRRTIRAIVFYPLLLSVAWPQSAAKLPALRSAVPLLCTENHQASRTRVRGSGVLVDSGGTLLTAAHVIQGARSDCTLSVLIPRRRMESLPPVARLPDQKCHLFLPLDLAVCRIRPADSNRDWAYIRPARIRGHSPPTGEPVWITAFTGWGVLPLVRSGRIQGRQIYQRKDGCYCDFATDIAAVEGMSGSPVITAEGEVLGILTLAGSGKFRGLSFGASLEEAANFLKAEGVLRTDSPIAPV